MSKTDPKTETKTVTVKLKQAHEHAGMHYGDGAVIPVPKHDAQWLINLDIAIAVDPEAAVQAPQPTEAK